MHKPEMPMDPIEEVESILKRLAPAAMSEVASRANEAMIDDLASGQIADTKDTIRRSYWWPAGIAASLIAGVGLFFLDQHQANAGAVGEYEFLESQEFTKPAPNGVSVEKSNLYKLNKSGLVVQVGERNLINTLDSQF